MSLLLTEDEENYLLIKDQVASFCGKSETFFEIFSKSGFSDLSQFIASVKSKDLAASYLAIIAASECFQTEIYFFTWKNGHNEGVIPSKASKKIYLWWHPCGSGIGHVNYLIPKGSLPERIQEELSSMKQFKVGCNTSIDGYFMYPTDN